MINREKNRNDNNKVILLSFRELKSSETLQHESNMTCNDIKQYNNFLVGGK